MSRRGIIAALECKWTGCPQNVSLAIKSNKHAKIIQYMVYVLFRRVHRFRAERSYPFTSTTATWPSVAARTCSSVSGRVVRSTTNRPTRSSGSRDTSRKNIQRCANSVACIYAPLKVEIGWVLGEGDEALGQNNVKIYYAINFFFYL